MALGMCSFLICRTDGCLMVEWRPTAHEQRRSLLIRLKVDAWNAFMPEHKRRDDRLNLGNPNDVD